MSPYSNICRIKLGTVFKMYKIVPRCIATDTRFSHRVFACAAVHSMANMRLSLMNIIFIFRSIYEGDTPPPFLVRSIQVFLGRTQYAKGQYAVRNNSVKSYAALKNKYLIVFRNYSRKYHTAIENKTRDWQINIVNKGQWHD